PQDFGLTPIPFRDDDAATFLTTFADEVFGGHAERAGPASGRLRPVCGTGTAGGAPPLAGVVATVDPAHQVCWGTAHDEAAGADAGDVIWIHPVTGGAGLIPGPFGERARGRVDSAFGGVVIYSGGTGERFIYR